MAKQIRLESSDKKIIVVDVKVAKMSATIKTMLEDLGMNEDNDEVVPLPSVEGKILEKIIEWAKKHIDDPTPSEEDDNKEKRSDDIPEWDLEFLKVDQPTLFAIIRAANFLDIKGLMDVTCKTVANMIKGKTPDEIRRTFNITPVPPSTDDDEAAKNDKDGESSGETSGKPSGEKKTKE